VDATSAAPENYSAEFLAAVERVLANEGGYSSNPDDPGGATNFGISARSNPGVNIAALTRDAAIEIYWRQWWLRFGFAQLPAAIAAKTFDSSINIGARPAIECLQRALRACGRPVAEDGTLGPATVLESHRAAADALLAATRSELAAHYRLVAAKQARSAAFLNGWLNRAYA